jgi:hypothetical protein
MIGYTLPELRRLLISLIQASPPDPEAVWSWSRWRRRRQYQARLCHYRRRGHAFAYVPPSAARGTQSVSAVIRHVSGVTDATRSKATA